MALASATRVGPYEILSILGAGAMGEVYRARDVRLDRHVALKVIAEECLGDTTKRRRFVQEARSASSLNHPNIVVVHDFGSDDGISYIASELVEGRSLRELIRQGPVPIPQLLDIASQIADGIAEAHKAGIIHRDLKPENIMLTREGRVKILDFGLARPALASSECNGAEVTFDGGVTQPGLVVGTVGYMSPEQARGQRLTVQSDQFSLGLVLHEMATGQPAFKGDTPLQTLLAIVNAGQPPFTPGPVAYRLLVERCLKRDAEKRFADTAEIGQRIRKIRGELPLKAPAQPLISTSLQRVAYRVPARWRYIGLAACAAVALAAYLLARLFAWYPPAPEAIVYEPAIAQTGFDVAPAVDASGRMLAWSGDVGGVLQIFTARSGADAGAPVTSLGADCLFPFWSRDGQRVFFISEHQGGAALWSVAAAGGAAELVMDKVIRAAISTAGTIALLRPAAASSSQVAVWLLRGPGREAARFVPLGDRSFPVETFVGFSPDGRRLGVFAPDGDFIVAPVNGGRVARYRLARDYGAHPFSWVVRDRVFWGAGHLRVADLRQGRVWQLTSGAGVEGWPAAALSSLFFSTARTSWRAVSFAASGAAVSGPAAGRDAVWSPVQREVAWIADSHGTPEIRLRDAVSGWQRVVARAGDFPGSTDGLSDLAFAPGGRRLAVVRRSGAFRQIWIAGLNGQQPIRGVPADGVASDEEGPAWSPDEQWLAFMATVNGRRVLAKARAGSTEAPLVIQRMEGTAPMWSPDGQSIAVLAGDGGIAISPSAGGPVRRVGDGRWLCAVWNRDAILGIREVDRRLSLTRLQVDSGGETRIGDAGPLPPAFGWARALGEPPPRASLSPDGVFTTTMMDARSTIWTARGLN